jgi:DNA-binding NarL/FixJ family response regulator
MTETAVVKRRILFVDDEPNVLDGLRNLLRKQRHQWEMLFATSGKAALDELARMPVDVIVSDMRMPGMDGAELLGRVRELYPQTARIVLSGHAERDAIARVVSVAHQFLSKPTDANTVRVVIERTCRFQALMLDPGIRRVVGGMEQLPSLPDTYFELTRATEDPDSAIADIAKIVERDLAMSVKVLQLVNSAYFGLAQKTESITRAVTYLGVENLKGLLVAVHVFSADNFPVIEGLSPTTLRDQARRWRARSCAIPSWPTRRSRAASCTTSATSCWRAIRASATARSGAPRARRGSRSASPSCASWGSPTAWWALTCSASGACRSCSRRPWRFTTSRAR